MYGSQLDGEKSTDMGLNRDRPSPRQAQNVTRLAVFADGQRHAWLLGCACSRRLGADSVHYVSLHAWMPTLQCVSKVSFKG